jgi:two-component system LytT family response regulator
MLSILIIDDEKLAREKLKRLLLELNDPELQFIGEAQDGLDALEKIESLKPDAVIIDIQMPGLNGLEVIRNITYSPAVIFSTAYDQYAIQAFESNAVDYLLKPYDKERMAKALHKLKSYSEHRLLQQTVKKIVADMSLPTPTYIELLPTRTGERIKLFKAKDVLWFDSEHSITYAHQDTQKHDIRYTLNELEYQLNPKDFFRIHRSVIINLHHIAEIVPWFNGQYKLTMNDKSKTELTVSRGRAQDLKKRLNW